MICFDHEIMAMADQSKFINDVQSSLDFQNYFSTGEQSLPRTLTVSAL
jgi:hypothetical protein